MERNGFNPSSPETSVSETGDSSDKEASGSSKKKKKGSAAEVSGFEKPVDEAKKEQVAERTKELLDKLVGIGAEKEVPAGSKKEKKPKSDNAPEHAGEQVEKTETAEEHEHEVEALSEEEQAEVVAAYAPARIAELEAGRSEEEDPADAAAREADIAYLKEVLEGGLESEVPVSTEEEPVNRAEQDMDLVESNIEPLAETPAAVEDKPDELSDDETIPVNGGTSTPQNQTPKSTPLPVPSVSPASSGSGGGNRNAPPTPAGSAGGSGDTVPPHQAINPAFMYGGGPVGPNFNSAPAAPTIKAGEYIPDYHQNPNASYLLVGGIVGYFIGRRRGRITTEKKMKVVQHKLEKQVESIQSTVAQKELEVQKLARERYWQQRAAGQRERPATATTEIALAAKTSETRETYQNTNTRENIIAPLPILEYAAERRSQIPQAERAAVAMPARERQPVQQREAQPRAEAVVPKQIQELSTEQLMVASEKIKVGNTNLKRIYEARLVTESGLKRLVHEFIENKDIRRGLAREFLAKELSYERDPRFRELLPPAARGMAGAATVKGGQADLADESSGAASQSAADKQSTDNMNTAKDKPQKQQAIPNGLLAALTLLALGLAAYAVLLSLTR
jgi:hypothetical protein